MSGCGCGRTATVAHTATLAARDLRDPTAEVLRQVADGGRVTVHGAPVAEIGPVRSRRSLFLARADLQELLAGRRADAGLTEDLDRLAGETTDDLEAP